MRERLKFHRELAKLTAWERRARRGHTKDCERAEKEGKPKPDKMNLMGELWMIDDERKVLLSGRLLQEARRYGVPTPTHDEEGAWDETQMGCHLSVKKAAELRVAIRQEKSERWELRLKGDGHPSPGNYRRDRRNNRPSCYSAEVN
jgi:hypothetical protein